MVLRIGADIGGTFTDLIVSSDDGSIFYQGADDAGQAGRRGRGRHERALEGGRPVGSDVQRFLHGTTLFTNALIERKGALGAGHHAGFSRRHQIAREHRSRCTICACSVEPLAPRPLASGRRARAGGRQRPGGAARHDRQGGRGPAQSGAQAVPSADKRLSIRARASHPRLPPRAAARPCGARRATLCRKSARHELPRPRWRMSMSSNRREYLLRLRPRRRRRGRPPARHAVQRWTAKPASPPATPIRLVESGPAAERSRRPISAACSAIPTYCPSTGRDHRQARVILDANR